jgi:hypothetical protein
MHISTFMDHKYIDQFDIVESYLAGKLAAEESTEFEEHFVDCSECVDRLETTKAFVEGLRVVASDRVPAAVAEPYTTSRKTFAAAAGVLSVVVIAGAVLVFTQIRRYRVEADQARSASTQWERRYEEERQLSAATSKDKQESERELAEQVAQLRTEVENQKKSGRHDGVKVNPPILALSSTRGSDPLSVSVNTVTLSRSSSSFVITLALEGETGYRRCAITILSSQKQSIWKRGGIKPVRDAISLLVDSSLFHAGDYLLTLDGVTRDGRTSVVGQYPFRVLKTP